MALEDKLAGWTGPASATEKDKQDRTERMVRDAIATHPAFEGSQLRVYAKGSYPNNTNVRTDSDVDIAVECRDVVYWEEAEQGAHPACDPYVGPWTPETLRNEVFAALQAKFTGQVDNSGSTAIAVTSGTARVDADVVPCFTYHYYLSRTNIREGTRVFRKNGTSIDNFPEQHLRNGRAKNTRTSQRFKKAVRVLKRTENAMVIDGYHREVPSFLVECLTYNCPNALFGSYGWTECIRKLLVHIWESTQGDLEPEEHDRWIEVNECKYLFGTHQKWTRADARDFSYAAWNYLGLSS